MPGYRRPHTTAFAPSELNGFDALEKAFQGRQYTDLNGSLTGRSKKLELKRHTVPTTYADIPSSDVSSASSEGQEIERDNTHRMITPPHERSDDPTFRRTYGRIVTPPHLTRENSGLPPTPPTMANSDDAEPRAEGLASNAHFADAVRNAQHVQKSGLSINRHLPTPDPSPPATSEGINSTSLHSARLRPSAAQSLSRYPSSKGDSFHTAREDPSTSQLHLLGTPSPAPHFSSIQWPIADCDVSAGLGLGLGNSHPATPTYQRVCRDRDGKASEDSSRRSPPTPLQRKTQRSRSPYRPQRSTSDFDKHISYISDEAFQDQGHEQDQDEASAENLNNLVYKQILNDNVKRHSAMSNGGTVPAGVLFPQQEIKERRLRRTTKAQSLRNGSASNASRRPSSESAPHHQLRRKVGTIPPKSLEGSPIVESNNKARRIVSAPIGSSGYAGMNDMTRVAIDQTAKLTPDCQRTGFYDYPAYLSNSMGRQHTLRHAQKDNRLENSPSLVSSRRHISPEGQDRDVPPPQRHTRPIVGSDLERSRKLEPTQEQSSRIRGPECKIRHFSAETKFENNDSVRRTSLEHNSHLRHTSFDGNSHLRHTSLESSSHLRRISLDINGGFLPSSPRKSSDPRYLYPNTTPMSVSQVSDQTNIEVCEATGVNIYPHNNESLLIVQHGSRPVSNGKETPSPVNYLGVTNQQLGVGQSLFSAHVEELMPRPRVFNQQRGVRQHAPATYVEESSSPQLSVPNQHPGVGQPLFSARVEEPSPERGARPNPTIHVDSPLTNPREAPTPPAFKVIPPTPNEELDRQLGAEDEGPRVDSRPRPPQRSLSLAQRARRFSESFIEQPLFGRSLSIRKQPPRSMDDNESRPTHLSPLWRPNYIWDGYDSEDEFDDGFDDMPPPSSARLPQGGDTSHVEERKRSFLPRSMSVRMAGFRGQGGFLLGNSLGLDRHGSNNRRPYVVKKASSGGLGTKGSYVGELRTRTSEEMLRQMVGRKGVFTLPFSGGKKVQYVGVSRFREHMQQKMVEREEKQRENRRAALRSQIQHAK